MLDKNDLKKYYSFIKKNLSCSFNMKSVFIKDLNDRIYEFLEENPDSTIDDIIENFGAPVEIAKSFDKDSEYLKKKTKNRLIIEIVLLVLLITTISISCYFICTILNDLGGNTVITTE